MAMIIVPVYYTVLTNMLVQETLTRRVPVLNSILQSEPSA